MKENTSTQRKCTKCKTVKPLTSEFYGKDKNRQYGFMYKCKACEKLRKDMRVLRWRTMTPAQKLISRTANKKYAQTIKGKSIFLLSAYKKVDQRKGRACDLTQSDIQEALKGICFYCGSQPTGFDRKNNSIGHTKENCVPCCFECNTARMDNFTQDEMIIIGEAIRRVRAKRELQEIGNCVF